MVRNVFTDRRQIAQGLRRERRRFTEEPPRDGSSTDKNYYYYDNNKIIIIIMIVIISVLVSTNGIFQIARLRIINITLYADLLLKKQNKNFSSAVFRNNLSCLVYGKAQENKKNKKPKKRY